MPCPGNRRCCDRWCPPRSGHRRRRRPRDRSRPHRCRSHPHARRLRCFRRCRLHPHARPRHCCFRSAPRWRILPPPRIRIGRRSRRTTRPARLDRTCRPPLRYLFRQSRGGRSLRPVGALASSLPAFQVGVPQAMPTSTATSNRGDRARRDRMAAGSPSGPGDVNRRSKLEVAKNGVCAAGQQPMRELGPELTRPFRARR